MVRTPEQKEAARIRRERRARGEYKQSHEHRANISEATSGKTHSDATKAKMSEAKQGEKHPMFGKTHTDDAKAKNSKAHKGKHPTAVTIAKMSEAQSGENSSRGMSGKTHTDQVCKKIGESSKKTWLDKQWYGTVTYGKPPRCPLFDFKFEERCRAFDGYKSVLSGKTQAENICGGKPYRLTVHHVYYQEKALCGWDEDLEGFYAMINLGTERKPNMVRHNIKGDPNKFVTLTHSENIKANSNKLDWIKKFEDIIEARGGKCYLTKEEMIEYKKAKSI